MLARRPTSSEAVVCSRPSTLISWQIDCHHIEAGQELDLATTE